MFRVEIDQTDMSLEVRLIGQFDYLGFGQVDELLTDAQLGGNRIIVVDLGGLTSIDSTGIKALLLAHLRATAVGGHVSLIRVPDNVHRMFKLAGLDSRLDFFEDKGDRQAGPDQGPT
jgi:anti-anti-sigma factor